MIQQRARWRSTAARRGIGDWYIRACIIPVCVTCLFIIGWYHNLESLVDIGDRSVTLIMCAAIPLLCYVRIAELPIFLPQIASTIIGMIVASEYPGNRSISHGMQYFMAAGVCIGAARIDWARLLPVIRRAILLMSIPIYVYGAYQLIARQHKLPYAFLEVTNRQAYADGGLQRGYNDPIRIRASSVFVEPSDFGYYSNWLLILGLSCRRRRTQAILVSLAILGIVLSQSLGALIGMILMCCAAIIINRRYVLLPIIVTFGLGVWIATEAVYPNAAARFRDRVDAAIHLDAAADSRRISAVPEEIRWWLEAPWFGHGLGTKSVMPGTIANGFSLLLFERGILGTIMFLFPYGVILLSALKMKKNRTEIGECVLYFAILECYVFAVFASLYFLPFWFGLGIALSPRVRTVVGSSRRSRRGQIERPTFASMRELRPV